MGVYKLLMLTCCIIGTYVFAAYAVEAEKYGSVLAPWEPGYLDIHHINTGSGDATFFIFPDGTTMLFDAGDIDREAMRKYAPLKLTPPRPDASKRSGEWIVHYIRQIAPKNWNGNIDYALISHFHGDHFGTMWPGLPQDKKGQYALTGLSDVGSQLPILQVVDRAYPNYNYPVDLRSYYKKSKKISDFQNYLNFLGSEKISVAAFKPGVKNQIVAKYKPQDYPTFEVRNIKSNGTLWSGQGVETKRLFTRDDIIDGQGHFNENPLSLALKISYGRFDYFTGGDNTGLTGPGLPQWSDVETPMATVVGEVDVLVLNHHGNRDATNANFLGGLMPRVIVEQTWISDQPGGEVVHRMINRSLYPGPRDIFSTNMLEETKVAIGPWLTRNFASEQGHVVIRVAPGGAEYNVFVLDDTVDELRVKSVHGPYTSR